VAPAKHRTRISVKLTWLNISYVVSIHCEYRYASQTRCRRAKERMCYWEFVLFFIDFCVCSLNGVSNSAYVLSNDWMILNGDLERMWARSFMAEFKVQLNELRKTTKSLGSRPRFRKGTSRIKSDAFPLEHTCPVTNNF
jgi:hypothetical protein